ncbi:MAG: hypothetical protein J6Z10_04360, partial [Prevotella sp.]|nr:hypothetical protein [Prevotella sp.]
GEGGSCMKNKEKLVCLWFFPRLIVPLTSSKVLSLDKTKEKALFLLSCARLFVPLQRFINLKVLKQ